MCIWQKTDVKNLKLGDLELKYQMMAPCFRSLANEVNIDNFADCRVQVPLLVTLPAMK